MLTFYAMNSRFVLSKNWILQIASETTQLKSLHSIIKQGKNTNTRILNVQSCCQMQKLHILYALDRRFELDQRIKGKMINLEIQNMDALDQACYGSRIHQPLFFRRHHWLGKPTVTLIKNYQIKIVVLKSRKSQGA